MPWRMASDLVKGRVSTMRHLQMYNLAEIIVRT